MKSHVTNKISPLEDQRRVVTLVSTHLASSTKLCQMLGKGMELGIEYRRCWENRGGTLASQL